MGSDRAFGGVRSGQVLCELPAGAVGLEGGCEDGREPFVRVGSLSVGVPGAAGRAGFFGGRHGGAGLGADVVAVQDGELATKFFQGQVGLSVLEADGGVADESGEVVGLMGLVGLYRGFEGGVNLGGFGRVDSVEFASASGICNVNVDCLVRID